VRRLRGDLIQQFKIVNGIESVEFESPTNGFKRVMAPRGGRRAQHRREIVKNCNQRHNFFVNRVVYDWNSLPDKTISATTTANFKKLLDTAAADKRQGVTSYGVFFSIFIYFSLITSQVTCDLYLYY
jgi:hypothetical protein